MQRYVLFLTPPNFFQTFFRTFFLVLFSISQPLKAAAKVNTFILLLQLFPNFFKNFFLVLFKPFLLVLKAAAKINTFILLLQAFPNFFKNFFPQFSLCLKRKRAANIGTNYHTIQIFQQLFYKKKTSNLNTNNLYSAFFTPASDLSFVFHS